MPLSWRRGHRVGEDPRVLPEVERLRPQSRRPAPSSVDLSVLVLLGGPDEPTGRAWLAALDSIGAVYEAVTPSADEPLTIADLLHDDGFPHDHDLLHQHDRGRFHAVVLTTDSSAFWTSLPALAEYRRRFGVRQVNGFEYPRAAHGLQEVQGRALDGTTAQLTPAGRRHFGYLAGPVPVDVGTYGYPTPSPDGGSFTALLESPSKEALVGIATSPDGLEDMVVTMNYAEAMLHWRLLARGMLEWVTHGCHLGMARHYLACHVDDVLLPNAKRPVHDGSPGLSPTVRMTPEDVAAVVRWQKRQGFVLDLAFNGFGAADDDPLTSALLKHRDEFRWVNHTWSHLDMGLVPDSRGGERWRDLATVLEEIERNERWAAGAGVPSSGTALVTGSHSGLDNPNLEAALQHCGITAVAADASGREVPARLGPATVVRRHPTNVYTHVSTWPELLQEFNAQYAGAVPEVRSRTELLEAESRIALRRVLGNDPGPLFAHQSNLTDDRLLLDLLEHLITSYRALVGPSAPLVNLSMDDVAAELARRERWAAARQAGAVSATVGDDGTVTLSSTMDVEIPLTTPVRTGAGWDGVSGGRRRPSAFGQPYAGTHCGWLRLRAGETGRLVLPGGAVPGPALPATGGGR